MDFQDTFSPVIKLKYICLLLATEKDFEVHQTDVTAAYLDGTLEEDIPISRLCGEGKSTFSMSSKKKSLWPQI